METALDELKRVSENGTVAEIKPAIEKLQAASYKMAELLYKAASPERRIRRRIRKRVRPTVRRAQTNGSAQSDDVIDAEFKEAK